MMDNQAEHLLGLISVSTSRATPDAFLVPISSQRLVFAVKGSRQRTLGCCLSRTTQETTG